MSYVPMAPAALPQPPLAMSSLQGGDGGGNGLGGGGQWAAAGAQAASTAALEQLLQDQS